MGAARTLAVGIDLDDLRYYRGIHSLPAGPDTPVIFEVALPRFLSLCDRVGVRATLFAIADDLRWPAAAAALRAAAEAGHEVASHSLEHRYDLSRLAPAAIATDIDTARLRLSDAAGREVVGFRAPGYNLTDTLLSALARTGHRYDSSVLPSPPYFLARAAIIAGIRLRGGHSSSIVGRGRDFFRGRLPFRWRPEHGGLTEYPITACGPLRIPLIGTTLVRAGLAAWLVRLAGRLPFVNVEFHAIDFLGVAEDGVEPSLAIEPALKVPLPDRLASFETALRSLAAGRVPTTLSALSVDSPPETC